MLVPLIMAGGKGTRLYPASREARPKQLLRVFSDLTMIQETVARIRDLASPEQIFIGTTLELQDRIREQVPEVPPENYIIEPIGRDTAPAIAYAALTIQRRYPDAVMAVLSADQVIKPASRFHEVLTTAARAAAETHGLITMGIRPDRPETGYGYIKPGKPLGAVYAVERFTEKPDRETAARFVEEGYLWNSGMFVWEVPAICDALRAHVPDIYDGIRGIVEARRPAEEVFPTLRRISIDFGVMEKAPNVYVIEADFLWDDMGAWTSLTRVVDADEQGNVARGDFIPIDSTGCVVHSDGGLIAAIGVNDLVIVKNDDVVVICPKARDQEIKTLVQMLKSDPERQRYA
ncbi:MAG TPA: mannose-1-phosphate guanylyltransferase [Armatimonadetes bacterium]|jgi:mannose-1-phosphate guanylyltransferase|nr:mannose-1-phosphate guanylyltransferase [Armatimonadota bacterium]